MNIKVTWRAGCAGGDGAVHAVVWGLSGNAPIDLHQSRGLACDLRLPHKRGKIHEEPPDDLSQARPHFGEPQRFL